MKAMVGLQFPSTHWSAVRVAGETESEQGRQALGALLMRYQLALKAYLFKEFRYPEDQVNEWWQDFIHEVVMRRGLITQAKQGDTLFRSFLLTALHNFVISQIRRSQAQKRSPARPLESLEDIPESDLVECIDPQSAAAAAFDVAWARTVVTEALQGMEAECHRSGRKLLWIIFQARLAGPILQDTEPVPYEQLAAEYQLESESQARNLLTTGKRLFQRHLRLVIGQYVKEGESIESELVTLHEILSRARGW